FKYIGLPESNSETFAFLSGVVGTHNVRPSGQTAAVDFPGIVFMLAGNVNLSLKDMGNVVQFGDVYTGNTVALVQQNLQLIAGTTPVANVVLNIVYETAGVSSNDPASILVTSINSLQTAAANLGITNVNLVPIHPLA